MANAGDVRLQLNDLEAEEARIMRELRELDEKARAETEANRRRAEQYKDDPVAALTSLLLECEKEVRDAKGYIADGGPPLRIVRLRSGETGPKTATYLSRPRNTGVDFTVPVTLKPYTDLIKRPIFLNQIRDKIKHHKYASTDDYLEDMRLLAKNTAQFNKGPDDAWVVQHARYLLDAAEEAVASRRILFREVEEALRQRNAPKASRQNPSSLSAVGKRKRSQTQEKSNGDVLSATPPIGSAIEIYWPSYRKWYLAYINQHGEAGTCHLRYDEDNSVQWVTLDHERWRMRNSRVSGAARGKRAHEQPAKRRKAGTTASQVSDQPSYIPAGVTPEDLDAFKIDMFAKFEDFRETIVEYVKDHCTRMDREIIRSDTLSRVLVQGEDNRANTEGALQSMERRYDRLEKKVEWVVEKMMNSSFFGQSREGREDLQEEDMSGRKDISDRAKVDELRENPSRTASPRPGGRDRVVDKTDEDKNEKIDGDSTQAGVKFPDADSPEMITEERNPDDTRTKDPIMEPGENTEKQEPTKDKEKDQESENEQEEVQKTSITEKDLDMQDVADSDKQTGPDANDVAIQDDAAVSNPTKSDPKAQLEKNTGPVRDDAVNIEEHDNSNAGDDQKEEPDDSSDSDDSESNASVERGKIAGKQPATRRPVEKEPGPSRILKDSANDPAKDPDQQNRKLSEERASTEKGEGADVSTLGEEENVTVEERNADDERSKEKPSEEIETAAASAAGSEATERGKENSPNVREPNLIDRDTGD